MQWTNRARRCSKYALICFLVGAPLALLAQVTPLTSWVSTTFTITIVHPRDATDGQHIDCAPNQPNCRLFNLAACSEPGLPISFTLGTPATTQSAYTGTNQVVYAFLSQQASCTFSTVSGQTGNNPNFLIGTASSLAGSSVFFTGGTSGFNFPDNLSSFNAGFTQAASTGIVSTAEVLAAMNVCPPNTPSNQSIWYLCVGIDGDGSQGINNGSSTTTSTSTTATTATGSDPVAYLQFQVDTQPPPAPTVATVKPLNGRATVTGTFDSTEPDVYSITAFYTDDPVNLASNVSANPNDANAINAASPNAADANATFQNNANALGFISCDQWTGSVGSKTLTVYGQAANQVSFELDGLSNGKTYGVCLRAVDYLQNLSTPSATQTVTPRYECDLFACYPDTLHVGYCGGAATPSLWAFAIGSFVLWTLRQKRSALVVVGLIASAMLSTPLRAAEIDDIAAAQPEVESVQDEGHELERFEHQDARMHPTFAGDDLDMRAAHGDFQRASKSKRINDETFVDLEESGLDYGPSREGRVRWGASLSLGPYRPTFTTSPAGQAAYNHMLGGTSLFSKRPLALALSGEYYLLRRLGLFGPDLRVGFWQKIAPSRVCFASDGTTVVPCTATNIDSSQPGNDSQGLVVVPVSVGAVWRFDELARRTRVPLVLHARLTLDQHFWLGQSGGHGALYDGHRAWGGTWGYTLAGGVAINFNRITMTSSPQSDARIEYHLVGEYALVRGSPLFGPHRSERVDFTDNVFVTLGLLVQFR